MLARSAWVRDPVSGVLQVAMSAYKEGRVMRGDERRTCADSVDLQLNSAGRCQRWSRDRKLISDPLGSVFMRNKSVSIPCITANRWGR